MRDLWLVAVAVASAAACSAPRGDAPQHEAPCHSAPGEDVVRAPVETIVVPWREVRTPAFRLRLPRGSRVPSERRGDLRAAGPGADLHVRRVRAASRRGGPPRLVRSPAEEPRPALRLALGGERTLRDGRGRPWCAARPDLAAGGAPVRIEARVRGSPAFVVGLQRRPGARRSDAAVQGAVADTIEVAGAANVPLRIPRARC